jgi:hypothetical protein
MGEKSDAVLQYVMRFWLACGFLFPIAPLFIEPAVMLCWALEEEVTAASVPWR